LLRPLIYFVKAKEIRVQFLASCTDPSHSQNEVYSTDPSQLKLMTPERSRIEWTQISSSFRPTEGRRPFEGLERATDLLSTPTLPMTSLE